MYDYLEKNCNMSNWFDMVYFEYKLKNLKGAIKLMEQTVYEFNKETQVFELENSGDNFSFEFNREKEIIREIRGKNIIETKFKDFTKRKILSQEYFSTNTIELFEYDEETDLANKYIKIKNGIKTEEELKINVLKDGSIIHFNVNFEVRYSVDGNKRLEKSRDSDLEFVYDYSGYGKKGYFTKTQRIREEIDVVEKYGNKSDFLIEKVLYRNNIISSKKMLFFDETDKLVQLLTFFDDDSFENHYYFYNDKDLLIENKISLPNGYMGTHHLYEYDLHDNLTKTTDRTYEYKYDEQGNWIERIENYRNEVFQKTIREFTYFPRGLHLV